MNGFSALPEFNTINGTHSYNWIDPSKGLHRCRERSSKAKRRTKAFASPSSNLASRFNR